MNDYLNICPIDLITYFDNQFGGIIKPKNYSAWSKLDPFTILLEGINQFCVRVSFMHDSHEESGLRIPAQIKTLSLNQEPDYSDHLITGNCHNMNNVFLITFIVRNHASNTIANGQIYIATTLTKQTNDYHK